MQTAATETGRTVVTDAGQVDLPVRVSDPVELRSERQDLDLSVFLPTGIGLEDGIATSDGTLVFLSTDGSVDAAVQAMDDGGARVQTIINADAADHEFTYRFGPGIVPVLQGSEVLLTRVLDEGAAVVGRVDAPWAMDSEGQPVDTWFEVDGDALVQVVAPSESAQYPIVADPRFGWTGPVPTAFLNRAETGQARDTAGINVICAGIGLWNAVAGVVCAANTWHISSEAGKAYANGQCLRLLLGPGAVGAYRTSCS